MGYLGVNTYEEATKLSTPRLAPVGIPYFVGAAPVHTAEKPAKTMRPVLATSWDEAVQKLGYSDDWEKYPLCEAMYSHLRLFEAQPAIFCNVLDTDSMTVSVTDKEITVRKHRAILPNEALNNENLSVKLEDGTALEADTDYSAFYESYSLIVELLEGGAAYDAGKVKVSYDKVNTGAITMADIADGIAAADACMTAVGVVPDLILAPDWSHDPVIAALMATKCENVSGLFKAKALLDADTSRNGVREYSELTEYKNKNNLVDPNQILCWPMVTLGDMKFHLSVQLAGLMAKVDTDNTGIPVESPSNKNLKMDGCCLADGTEVMLTWPQVDLIAGAWGVVTAVNILDQGWTACGNYTACFPGNTDVKDQFIPVSRMFDFIANTLVRTFWPKKDKPLTTPLARSIVQTCNNWLGGLKGSNYLYGARTEILADENNITELLQGHIKLHTYNSPPVPAQRIDFVLEYDVSYAEAAIQI